MPIPHKDFLLINSDGSKYTLVVVNPKGGTNYKLPLDLALVLYQTGELCWDQKLQCFCTPFVDEGEVGLHLPLTYEQIIEQVSGY